MVTSLNASCSNDTTADPLEIHPSELGLNLATAGVSESDRTVCGTVWLPQIFPQDCLVTKIWHLHSENRTVRPRQQPTKLFNHAVEKIKFPQRR